MLISTLCLAVASLLPIVCAGIAKRAGFATRTFDNHSPREWLAKQEGAAGRANAAQQNSWEALAIFAPALLSAQGQGASPGVVDALAVAFVAVRLAYITLYITDRATLRSIVWSVGLAICFALLAAPWLARA